MIVFFAICYFYFLPVFILCLLLRRSYRRGEMTRDDVEGIFPIALIPVVNFFIAAWILNNLFSGLKLYKRLINLILGDKK